MPMTVVAGRFAHYRKSNADPVPTEKRSNFRGELSVLAALQADAAKMPQVPRDVRLIEGMKIVGADDLTARDQALYQLLLEIARLRSIPAGEQDFTAPLAGLKQAALLINSDATELFVRVGTREGELYQAAFEGPLPKVIAEGETVSIRYPRQLLGPGLGAKLGMGQRIARVQLSDAVAWAVSIRGGGSSLNVDLTGLPVTRDAAGVTLVNARNERTLIAASEIDELQDSPVSIMPADLYRQLSPQELRDLFAYLQRRE